MKGFLRFAVGLGTTLVIGPLWATTSLQIGFSRIGADNEWTSTSAMYVTVSEGELTPATAQFDLDLEAGVTEAPAEGKVNAVRASNRTDDTGGFFIGSATAMGTSMYAQAGYPAVLSQIKSGDTTKYWAMRVPFTIASDVSFNRVLPELYPCNRSANTQTGANKTFGYELAIYNTTDSEPVWSVTGQTKAFPTSANNAEAEHLNDLVLQLNGEQRLTAGDYSLFIKVWYASVASGSDVTYSGVKGVTFSKAESLTLTLDATGNGTWSNGGTEWPTSGSVIINATAVTQPVEVTLPASAAFDEIIVQGAADVKTTLTIGANTTITTLSPSGYVSMAVSDVNRVTSTVSVAAGGTFEVTTEGSETLSRAISGAGKFVKGGTGVLTLGANITAEGGSTVQSGTLKFSSSGTITTSGTPGSYTSNAMGDVRVCKNAVLDLNGQANLWLREITLEADATYKNGGAAVDENARQLQKLTLRGNATVETNSTFGLLAHGHNTTTLTLNGNTLTKMGTGTFLLMTTNVLSNGGEIVVTGGTVANVAGSVSKTVTFSDSATLVSALTGTPFNLRGGDVSAPAGLTANGTVACKKLIVGNTQSLAGTGTVTVEDMTLGGPFTLAGNLVIDRTGLTTTRTFNNAIKVASNGALTTIGDITWGADSNEFLGSLTVASGTLTIKTPDQKLGGNVTIASDATLTIAKTVTTTTTGVITGGGKLVIGDGSTASLVTLNGTLGTVTGEGASAQAFCAMKLEVASGSTLTLNNTVPTTLAGALSGSGAITLGGAGVVNVTAANGEYTGQVTINSGATLTNKDHGEPIPFGKGSIVNNGTLKLIAGTKVATYGCALLPPTSGTGDIVFCAGSETRLPAPIKTTGMITFEGKTSSTACDAAQVTFVTSTTDYFFGQAAAISGADLKVGEGVTLANATTNGATSPTVTVVGSKRLSGAGTIAVPVVFATDAIVDVADGAPTAGTVTFGERLVVAGAEPLTPGKAKSILKAATVLPTGVSLSGSSAPIFARLTEGSEGGVEVVLPSVPGTVTEGGEEKTLPTTLQQSLQQLAATEGVASVTTVTGVTKEAQSLSIEQIDAVVTLFEDVLQVAADGQATADYEFGVSRAEVHEMSIGGVAGSYVLLCAKVTNGAGDALDYAATTTVKLYQAGTPVAAATPTVEELAQVGLATGTGEIWFAVPLTTGTSLLSFTVKAVNE